MCLVWWRNKTYLLTYLHTCLFAYFFTLILQTHRLTDLPALPVLQGVSRFWYISPGQPGFHLVLTVLPALREKCPNTEFFQVCIFPHLEYLLVFSPIAGKYRPERTPYLDTFHALLFHGCFHFLKLCKWYYITQSVPYKPKLTME